MGNRNQLKTILIAVSVFFFFAITLASSYQAADAEPARASLDFQTYKTRVEPIFLKTREGGVRCYDCHSALATRFRLQPSLRAIRRGANSNHGKTSSTSPS